MYSASFSGPSPHSAHRKEPGNEATMVTEGCLVTKFSSVHFHPSLLTRTSVPYLGWSGNETKGGLHLQFHESEIGFKVVVRALRLWQQNINKMTIINNINRK